MRRTYRSAIPLVITGFAVLMATAACTGSGSAYSSSSPLSTGPVALPPGLYADRAFDLGPMVVDEQGMTIYRYDKDTAAPPRSNCVDTCAQTWQPIRPNADLKLEGIDSSLIGSVTRTDGTDQVTLAGWPLYRYTKDELPGETAGQGMAGAWYPIQPDGQKVQAVADPGKSSAFGI